ncbi:hypothetical protein WDU99_12175 [Microbacterium sp. Mu-80]|uniref:Uncharacterized protein n=1 Tax=Microbacterium bandirmense TaxID=3122050 RepID=A0ABU8LDH3_9MICO
MGLGPTIRRVTDAMDGVPIHVRQLADMFRLHGAKTKRNGVDITDLDDTDIVPDSLQNGWKKDGPTPNQIIDADKSTRPDPSEYLTDDYITKHKELFNEGATRFYTQENLDRYGPGNGGETFVFPTSEYDRIRAEAKTPQELATNLGLSEDFFVDADIVKAQFTLDELNNGKYHVPTGNEGGANAQWIPGGILPDGSAEVSFEIHPNATPSDPSVGGTWGKFEKFEFGS